MDHDPGSGAVERDHVNRLLYEQLGMVHDVPGPGGHRRSQLQYNCSDHYLGLVYAQYAVQDVGLLLFCHSRRIGIRVSF